MPTDQHVLFEATAGSLQLLGMGPSVKYSRGVPIKADGASTTIEWPLKPTP